MPDLIDLRRENPHRPPNWISQLAKYFHQRRLAASRHWGNDYSFLAGQYLAGVEQATSDNERWRVHQAHPHIHKAYTIHGPWGVENKLRWEIEARILAREPITDIAKKTNTPVTSIETYVAIFFDVTDRLDKSSFITRVVINPQRDCAAADFESMVLWKLLGYTCGPRMVDFLVGGPPSTPTSRMTGDVDGILTPLILKQVKLRTLQTVYSPRADQRTVAICTASFLEIEKQAKAAGVEQGALDSLRQGIMSVLENLPWTKSEAEAKQRGMISPREKNGVGLRADELMLEATQQLPEGFDAMLESCKYPDKIVKKTTVTR